MANDIIFDSQQALIDHLKASGALKLPSEPEAAEQLLAACREAAAAQTSQLWAGDRVYIDMRDSRGRTIAQRNAAICRDHAHGAHVSLLARRYQLGESSVWKILQQARGGSSPPACLTDSTNPVQPADTKPQRQRRQGVTAPDAKPPPNP